MKAIETRYAGCRFRSRLEARWAVFFDTLEVKWEYEPEGFELPSGRYLPDFLLSSVGVWFEVKGEPSDDKRWPELVVATRRELIVAFGMPRPDQDLIWGGPDHNGWMHSWNYFGPNLEFGEPDPYAAWDNGRAFCTCSWCERIGIEFEGRSGRMPCNREHGNPSHDGPFTADDPEILAAYIAARSARFEHGESG